MKKMSIKKWEQRSSIKLVKIPKGEIVIQAFGHPIGPKDKTTVFRWTFVMVTPRGTVIRKTTGVKSDPRLRGILCAPVLSAVMRGIEAAKKEGYKEIMIVSSTAFPEAALDIKRVKPYKMSIMLCWTIRKYKKWVLNTVKAANLNLKFAVRTK